MNSMLPSVVQDDVNLAVEACIKKAFTFDLSDFMLCPIENLNEKTLSILAEENHVLGAEGWNLAQTKEQKQKLIKDSVVLHSKKGTEDAIMQALTNLGIEAKIIKWIEYGGRIGHFKVEFLNLYNRGLDSFLEGEIKAIIAAYKPLTRILDVINFFLCSKAILHTAARVKTLEKVVIRTKGVQI